MRNAIILSLFLAGTFTGCRSLELPGHWRDHEISIDGKNTDWEYVTTLDDKQTYVGTMNDGEFLFVVLTTWNRSYQQQILRQGLTVWINKEASENTVFGIHYPLGIGAGIKRPGADMRDNDRNLEEGAQKIAVSMNELELCGPGQDERHRMTMAETAGIEARMHAASESLIFELKVPLQESAAHPFGIGTKPGSQIALGFEVVRPKKAADPVEGVSDEGPMQDPDRSGIGERSGMGPRGGGRGRRSGGDRGSTLQADALKVWTKVTLAVPPQTK
ncbi:MAG: hypothetical protein NTV54_13270 [Ignavibacteriales bacterium]|nr:hypothetical protein [Ignavibacteriales bacterium]